MRVQNLLPHWVLQLIQHPRTALSDIPAGLMMAVLVIPQSLGYAALAGLPPIMGLYAAIAPVIVYA
ncbi:SulP family inorganic anion transporter, partial [Moraxella catarrhalis]